MSLLIFRYFLDSHSPYFFKKMAYGCSRKKHSKWYWNMEKLKHKAGLRVTEEIIIFEINTTLYFKILYVALSGLVLIWNLFKETYFCHLHAYLLACFYEKHFKFLTSHIYFLLGDSELWKQYQSVNQEMM